MVVRFDAWPLQEGAHGPVLVMLSVVPMLPQRKDETTWKDPAFARVTLQQYSRVSIAALRWIAPVTEAVGEALRQVLRFHVAQVAQRRHQGRPQDLLRPRAGAVHAA